MRDLVLLMSFVLAVVTSTAFAGGYYSGLPQFQFSADAYSETLHGPDPSFNASVALKDCQNDLSAQEALASKLRFTVVNKQACAVRQTGSGVDVYGSFSLLK